MHTIKLALLLALASCACAPPTCATSPGAPTTGDAPTSSTSTTGDGASSGDPSTGTGPAAADLGAGSTTGDACPPCPGPAECAAHVTPDGVCEDACDVLDLACEASGLAPADCGLAHWLCSQGDDPCGIAAERGNDDAGRLCACALACAPTTGTTGTTGT